jgi:phosphoribosylamine--glycine ligase
MNILIIGGGGREHALADKIASSTQCSKLFVAPGNAGTALLGKNVPVDPNDFEAIKAFVTKEDIGMVVVGPEAPLVSGIVDFFAEDEALKNIPIIGPSKAGAQLEGSKAFAKAFMGRHNIPTATYRSFHQDQLDDALSYLGQHTMPVVLKADGLAAGKGVLICSSPDEARREIQEMLSGKFGAASATVVIEQFLSGIEFSVFVLTDGNEYVLLPEAKDYKRIGEGDTGLNTGGMGAVSPVHFADEALMAKVKSRIIEPTIKGIREEKIKYTGFVFFGLIVVKGEPYVIEYNCRLGDPETEVIIPRLQTDLVDLMLAAWNGKLSAAAVHIDTRSAVTIVLSSGGYPGDFEKGKTVHGLDHVDGSRIYHAGATIYDGHVITSGGRVMAVTSMASTLTRAIEKSLINAETIQFEGKYYRKDIGKDLL